MNVRAAFRPTRARGSSFVANTILAGAQKSGTTSLSRFIGAHPHCLMSEPKETNFFSRAANLGNLEKYSRCFQGAGQVHRTLVDGTTTYMADPAIALRIRDRLGANIKIIFILRNPVARTYSSFLHMAKRGHERRIPDEVFLGLPDHHQAASSRERASVVEAAIRGRVVYRPYRKLYDDVLWNYRYVGNSLYSSLVENYLAAFGRENILVLFFEDVVHNLGEMRLALGEFLGVDSDLFPSSMPKDNPTRIPEVSTPLGWLTEQARRIKGSNFTLVHPREVAASAVPPSPEVAAKLRRIFAAEVGYWSDFARRDLQAIGW